MEINEKDMMEISEKIRRCEEEISKGIIGQKDIIRNVFLNTIIPFIFQNN